jgi:hypothetical protein
MAPRVILVDTNVILEAVRTGVWRAITGGTQVHTVQECVDESRRGDRFSGSYIAVGDDDLARLTRVHLVGEAQRATLDLALGDIGLDDGERDLYAHCLSRSASPEWVVSSPDRAAVRAAVRLGWNDRLVSLEELARLVGCPPARLGELRRHFRSSWLKSVRTDALLEGGDLTSA